MKVLLENLLRREDGAFVKADDIRALAQWNATANVDKEISSCGRAGSCGAPPARPVRSIWQPCGMPSSS